MVEWHCLRSGPHLCGSINKAGPRNAALSFQGGFGFVVHRWHRVLDSPSRGDISLCGETQELALHRFNAGAVCFDVVFAAATTRRNPRCVKALAAPAPQR
jgi:hypothetical protein